VQAAGDASGEVVADAKENEGAAEIHEGGEEGKNFRDLRFTRS
jgi:hypothetical protein